MDRVHSLFLQNFSFHFYRYRTRGAISLAAGAVKKEIGKRKSNTKKKIGTGK
jgi:hypothetical protein